MSRRSMRTLTLKAAAARTGLPVERLRRAVAAGHIQAFRETTGRGRHRRGTFYLLEASLERWFFAHVTGTGPTPLEAPSPVPVRDVDDELIAATPVEDRFV